MNNNEEEQEMEMKALIMFLDGEYKQVDENFFGEYKQLKRIFSTHTRWH